MKVTSVSFQVIVELKELELFKKKTIFKKLYWNENI